MHVVKAGGDKFELWSVNEMGDGSKSKGCLYIRTQDKLYGVEQ